MGEMPTVGAAIATCAVIAMTAGCSGRTSSAVVAEGGAPDSATSGNSAGGSGASAGAQSASSSGSSSTGSADAGMLSDAYAHVVMASSPTMPGYCVGFAQQTAV